MRLRTDALRVIMRAPMPTLAQKNTEREQLAQQIEQFKQAASARGGRA